MFLRIALCTMLALNLVLVLGGCADFEFPGEIEGCVDRCPASLEEVERCPAFASCKEFPTCGGELLLCVEPEESANDDEDPHPVNCEEPLRCPRGSLEVIQCPDAGVCTTLRLCERELICLESPEACAQEPLCPDGDRGVRDRPCEDGDASCYRHLHCSGPLTCLRCDLLPTSCPEHFEPANQESCAADDAYCKTVETCEEDLLCKSLCPLQCPDQTVRLADCPDGSRNCFARTNDCGLEYFCGAPAEDCNGEWECPDDYDRVLAEECLAEEDKCLLKAMCGVLTACLPAE